MSGKESRQLPSAATAAAVKEKRQGQRRNKQAPHSTHRVRKEKRQEKPAAKRDQSDHKGACARRPRERERCGGNEKGERTARTPAPEQARGLRKTTRHAKHKLPHARSWPHQRRRIRVEAMQQSTFKPRVAAIAGRAGRARP